MGGGDVQFREAVERMMSRLNTCLPGVVMAFDADRQLVDVQPCLTLRGVDGTEVALPVVVKAPLVHPRAGGFALTLPVRAGDPCLILFAQRNIEAWLERGGVPPSDESPLPRHHDLTDALVVLAPSPLPTVLGAWNTTGAELRNESGDVRVAVEEDRIDVVVGATQMVVNASGVIITGNLLVSGTVESQTSVADPKGTIEEMRGVYNAHTHMDTNPTDSPTQQMT